MEVYGHSTGRSGSQADPPGEWAETDPETGLEESMRSLILHYPEQSGVPDCPYYMRTGSCGYGIKCRFNHPRDRSSVGGNVGWEYPERIGEPECQYYLRTGTCKYGASCKFHHPRNGGLSLSDVPVNIYGHPLRPGEKECSYYLKTGHCKFGRTCKFHHPQLAPVSPLHPTVQSSAPSPEQYGGLSTSYSVARPPLVPSSYVSGAYGPLMLSPGIVPIPNWSSYSGPVSPSPGVQPSVGATSLYGMQHLPSSAPTFAGPSSDSQIERVFPERPGQPECQYYIKTGDCKYGSSCKYHHPPDWVGTQTNCVLSHIGLPLRPGVQPCNFYLQNGYCKFGQTCKFDHPVGTSRYDPSASSFTDLAVAPYMLQSSPLPFPQVGHVSISDVQLSHQNSPPLSVGRSTRQSGES